MLYSMFYYFAVSFASFFDSMNLLKGGLDSWSKRGFKINLNVGISSSWKNVNNFCVTEIR